MDNTDDELFIIRKPIETTKPSSQPDADTSSYSSSTPRTASKYTLSPRAALPSALT